MSDVCTCKTHRHVIRVIPWVNFAGFRRFMSVGQPAKPAK